MDLISGQVAQSVKHLAKGVKVAIQIRIWPLNFSRYKYQQKGKILGSEL